MKSESTLDISASVRWTSHGPVPMTQERRESIPARERGNEISKPALPLFCGFSFARSRVGNAVFDAQRQHDGRASVVPARRRRGVGESIPTRERGNEISNRRQAQQFQPGKRRRPFFLLSAPRKSADIKAVKAMACV